LDISSLAHADIDGRGVRRVDRAGDTITVRNIVIGLTLLTLFTLTDSIAWYAYALQLLNIILHIEAADY
jgi:hypothetical protein